MSSEQSRSISAAESFAAISGSRFAFSTNVPSPFHVFIAARCTASYAALRSAPALVSASRIDWLKYSLLVRPAFLPLAKQSLHVQHFSPLEMTKFGRPAVDA